MNVATPIKWGDLEEQIIAERLVPSGGEDRPKWLLGVVTAPVVLLLGAFILSPVVGAALVTMATKAAKSSQADLTLIASFMFVVSIVVSATWLSMWWQTRSRSMIAVISGVLAAVSVLVTFVVGKSYEGDLPGDWLEILALVAGVLGLVLTILQLVSKSERRAGVPTSDRAQRRYSAAREEVLDVLAERGVVDLTSDQRHRMRRMRVGTWHKFDAQGRV